jgi:hypothetical protein
MNFLLPFLVFEEEKSQFSFDELSPEAKENAIQNVREKMWQGDYGAYHIGEWVVDDDYLLEPLHSEMEEVFGPGYNDDLGGIPMIGNDRKEIYFVSKEDQNYYLHCAKAIDINNQEMFLGWLGIPPFFWNDLVPRFYDTGTYTKIEIEVEDTDQYNERQQKLLDDYLESAKKKWELHMENVLDRITREIKAQYEDAEIEERIKSNEILFDEEGDIID